MSFVIRRKDGLYSKGRGGYLTTFVEDLQEARTYGRRTDASNSLHRIASHFRRTWKAEDFEVVPVKIALVTGEPEDNLLERLEAYGVDNWQGYHDAYNDTEGYFKDE